MPEHGRVLVVEDDPDIRGAIADTLSYEGYSVSEAPDGVEALRRARSERPDLILLDLMMPVMDGWAFRAEQEADPSIAEIPVVVVTACQAQDDRVRALRAAAFLQKPFDIEMLLEIVHRWTSVH
jgi:CheY-like chemotaxis protein